MRLFCSLSKNELKIGLVLCETLNKTQSVPWLLLYICIHLILPWIVINVNKTLTLIEYYLVIWFF